MVSRTILKAKILILDTNFIHFNQKITPLTEFYQNAQHVKLRVLIRIGKPHIIFVVT